MVQVVIGGLFIVSMLVAGGIKLYRLDRDLDSVMDRAQVAADAGDMLGYMLRLQEHMQMYGATTGHSAYVLRTPRNDLALQHQTVKRLVERLRELSALSKDSAAYQAGLDDVRGIIREMPRLAYAVFWCLDRSSEAIHGRVARTMRTGPAFAAAFGLTLLILGRLYVVVRSEQAAEEHRSCTVDRLVSSARLGRRSGPSFGCGY